MASVKRHGVLEFLTTFNTGLITRVNHPSESLHKNSRTKVFSTVPPVRRTRSGAAGTENAFVKTIKLLTISNGLEVFLAIGREFSSLKVGLNRLVLLVEMGQVRNQITNNIHVRQRINLLGLGEGGVDAAKTGKGVVTVNVHGTGTANTFTARTSESEGGILLILNLEQSVQNHRTAVVQVDVVCLELRLLFRLIRVPSVDLELFDTRSLGGRCGCQAADKRSLGCKSYC